MYLIRFYQVYEETNDSKTPKFLTPRIPNVDRWGSKSSNLNKRSHRLYPEFLGNPVRLYFPIAMFYELEK
jgi:hypothetical protein